MQSIVFALAALAAQCAAHCEELYLYFFGFDADTDLTYRHIPVARCRRQDHSSMGQCSSDEQLQHAGTGMYFEIESDM